MKARLWKRYQAAFPDPASRLWPTKVEFYKGYRDALKQMREFLNLRVDLDGVFG